MSSYSKEYLQKLFNIHQKRWLSTSKTFERPFAEKVEWEERLIIIKGFRGVGKTTFLLQYAHRIAKNNSHSVLYVTMDDLVFEKGSLLALADTFYVNGGEVLLLDEIHRYENWSQELKNIYDTYPTLKVVATGSSILHINEGNSDLSRRAVVYEIEGLSFREYLQIETHKRIPIITIDELLKDHVRIAMNIASELRPLEYFYQYLEIGYYPYYLQNKNTYQQKLLNIINLIIEADITLLKNIEPIKVHRIKRLLYMLSTGVPYQPNISKLSTAIEISRPTVMEYLLYLEDAKLISMLRTKEKSYDLLTKPEKIYLEHPNLSYTIAPNHVNQGSVRETFVLNQLKTNQKVYATNFGDFITESGLTFEVGGKNKVDSQIKDVPNAYLAIDGIEAGAYNRIPIWLFGLLA
jgi:hypothetical protein